MDNLIAQISDAVMPPKTDFVKAGQHRNTASRRHQDDFRKNESGQIEKTGKNRVTGDKTRPADKTDDENQYFDRVLAKRLSGNDQSGTKSLSKNTKNADKETSNETNSEPLTPVIILPQAVNKDESTRQIPGKNSIIVPAEAVNLDETDSKTVVNSTNENQKIIESAVIDKAVEPGSAEKTIETVVPVEKISVSDAGDKKEAVIIPGDAVSSESNKGKLLKQTTENEIPQNNRSNNTENADRTVLENMQNNPKKQVFSDKLPQITGENVKAAVANEIKTNEKPANIEMDSKVNAETANGIEFKRHKADYTEAKPQTPQASTGLKEADQSGRINSTVKTAETNTNTDPKDSKPQDVSAEINTNPRKDDFNQIFNDADMKIADSSNIKTQKATIASNASNTVSQVVNEIRSSSLTDRQQISIALDPPELGRINIRFQQKNGEIIGLLEADNVKTRQEISDEMPLIIRSLNEGGIAVKKVEVVLTQQDQQDSMRGNSSNEFDNTGRENPKGDEKNSPNHGENFNRNSSGQYIASKATKAYESSVSDEAIDLYV